MVHYVSVSGEFADVIHLATARRPAGTPPKHPARAVAASGKPAGGGLRFGIGAKLIRPRPARVLERVHRFPASGNLRRMTVATLTGSARQATAAAPHGKTLYHLQALR